MQEADMIASTYGHNYIGTEHITMACVRCDSPPVLAMFEEASLDITKVKAAFMRSFEQGFNPEDIDKEKLILALREALARLEK